MVASGGGRDTDYVHYRGNFSGIKEEAMGVRLTHSKVQGETAGTDERGVIYDGTDIGDSQMGR